MITLKTDRGLVEVSDWADLKALPGFQSSLRLEPDDRLNEVLGRYHLKDARACGLAECRTAHLRGYVVSTIKGLVTNIGKNCGANYLGLEFDEQSRRFDQLVEASDLRTRLWNFAFRADQLMHEVELLKAQGLPVKRQIEALQSRARGCPQQAVDVIREAAKEGGPITIVREATARELEIMDAAGAPVRRPAYVDVEIARLDGVQALSAGSDLRQLIVMELEQPLQQFIDVDIDQLPLTELRRFSKFIGTIDGTMNQIREALESAKQLLTQANLRKILPVLDDPQVRHDFEAFLDTVLVAAAGPSSAVQP